MKCLFVLFVVAVAASCALGQGIPIANCPPGEHSVLYCPQMAEPSCENPTVHDLPPGSAIAPCDIPECFCDSPTVRDLSTNKCINLSDC